MRRNVSAPTAWPALRGSPRFCLLLAGAFLLFFGHNTLASYLYRVAQWKGNADAQGTATLLSALLELPILFGFPLLLRKAGSGSGDGWSHPAGCAL